MEQTLPDWLTAYPTEESVPKYPVTKEQRELKKLTYESVFESFLDHIQEGGIGSRFIKTDPRNIDYGDFIGWVKRDTERKNRFEEAQEIGADILVDEARTRALGEDSLEDVARSQLATNTLLKIAAFYNRKRYGDKVQVDSSVTTIDMTQAMQHAEQLARERIVGHGSTTIAITSNDEDV